MRNELRKIGGLPRTADSIDAIKRIDQLASFLLEIDPDNGHGLYFKGEV
jgi:hypothetical protein